jgi:hypothetical protein
MGQPYEGDSTSQTIPGIKGTNAATGGIGVWGESQQFEGVHGVTHSQAAGVAGYNDNVQGGPGVWGESQHFEGVHGISHSPAAGVAGYNDDPQGGPGVWGEASKGGGEGVHGVSHTGFAGVAGYNDNPQGGPGTWGRSEQGEGIHGETNSTAFAAVAGVELNTASNVAAVYGEQRGGGPGLYGIAHGNGAGVFGTSANGEGVHGETTSPTLAAVAGITLNPSSTGAGVYGESRGQGPAGFFKGNVVVTGDIFLTGADCAEDFDTPALPDIEPGTVMVIGQNSALCPSQEAYDKTVAGVVAGAGAYQPGIVLDRRTQSANRRSIALLGKAYCKVDATHEPIAVGDLLTTSRTPGHAMKASDPTKAFGAVIGKALGSLGSGRGLIPILIALQ